MTEFSITPLKRCSKCKNYYQRTVKFFRKDNSAKDGLQSQCKTCGKLWYQDNAEKVKKASREWEINNPERVRARGKKYREENTEYLKEYKREYAKNHPEQIRANAAKSRKKHIDKYREIGRNYYYNNKQRFRDNAKRRRINKPIEYLLKKREKEARRNARLKNIEGTFNSEDIKRLYEEQDGMCRYCGIRIFWNVPHDVQIDHIRPVSKGGSNWPSNLCLCCGDCNSSKNDSLLENWIKRRGW